MIKYGLKIFREQDGKTYYMYIFSDLRTVECYKTHPSESVQKIDVREASESEKDTTCYYGFLTNEGDIDNISPTRGLLDMCYPYGVRAEERENKTGKVIKVIITEIYNE